LLLNFYVKSNAYRAVTLLQARIAWVFSFLWAPFCLSLPACL